MANPRYQHTLQLPAELEEQWQRIQQEQPQLSFNGFVCQILEEAFKCPSTIISTSR